MIEFFVNTELGYFENWLREFHIRQSPSLIELEPDTKWLAVFGGFQRTQSHLGHITFDLGAHIQTRIDENSVQASHEFTVIIFRILPLSTSRLRIEARCTHGRLQQYFGRILEDIAKSWPESRKDILGEEDGQPNDDSKNVDFKVPTYTRKSGMSELRKRRAFIFKEIKDANPYLSYPQVATRANLDYKDRLDKIVFAHDVRNDYRDMGWTWHRADRIK